jgi:hypothetical protein
LFVFSIIFHLSPEFVVFFAPDSISSWFFFCQASQNNTQQP